MIDRILKRGRTGVREVVEAPCRIVYRVHGESVEVIEVFPLVAATTVGALTNLTSRVFGSQPAYEGAPNFRVDECYVNCRRPCEFLTTRWLHRLFTGVSSFCFKPLNRVGRWAGPASAIPLQPRWES